MWNCVMSSTENARARPLEDKLVHISKCFKNECMMIGCISFPQSLFKSKKIRKEIRSVET